MRGELGFGGERMAEAQILGAGRSERLVQGNVRRLCRVGRTLLDKLTWKRGTCLSGPLFFFTMVKPCDPVCMLIF